MHRNSDCVRWDPATACTGESRCVCDLVSGRVKTMEEFMQALKKGGMKPAYYEDGAYHILEVQEYGNGYPKVGF